MEHGGAQNGVAVRTNHDRDLKIANGVNGAVARREPSPNKVTKAGGLAPMVNGDTDAQKAAQAGSSVSDQATMNTLPPEIAHITENFFPLPFILQRLAQKSHNELQLKIEELANMPVGQGAMNGNASGSGEDSSEANQNKKANLLTFVQDMHSKWVKALVMSEWSRKSGQVSKLIDLHAHIIEELRKYDMVLDRMGHIKRNLYGARLPDPDIKTALQVLSTGQAPWMPDFNLIPPPVLSSQEIMKWINELNVLLSFRLNLDDYDKIPPQFKDYSIDNGRATFRVKGEFEVDLTIADDDFEKQWWFIDFRFTFSPAPQEFTDRLRHFVEEKVNTTLDTDGLKGCYDFLHEFVLTHKINELRRQAVVVSRELWIDNIRVEPLNRALSIQYWTNKFAGSGPSPASNASPKSWIIVGVNSGRTPPPTAPLGSPSTSYLTLRWFRDGKEVTDEDLSFDTEEISAEALLKRIIGKHVKHILTSIHAKLLSKPRYANRQASVSLDISNDNPSESSLAVQITHSETLVVRINAITGAFLLQPIKTPISRRERQLNLRARDRARDSIEEGFTEIENIRCASQFDELVRRGRGMGWLMWKRPVQADEVRKLLPSREPHQAVWLKLEGWSPAWYVVVCLTLAGDSWWIVEITGDSANKSRANTSMVPTRPHQQNPRNSNTLDQPSGRIRNYNMLPIKPNPEFSVAFFVELAVMTTDAMESLQDHEKLRSNNLPFAFRRVHNPYISSRLKIPALYVKTAAILQHLPRAQSGDQDTKRQRKVPWAGGFVKIVTRAVYNRGGPRLEVTREAKVMVRDKSKFSLIKRGFIGHDVYYDLDIGQFRMAIRVPCDESCIPLLETRLKAIDRLVDFVTSINDRASGVKCDSITLRKLIFTYGDTSNAESVSVGRYKVILDLAKDEVVNISLEPNNPHIRVWDMLKKLVNSPIGLEQLPYWLQTTLPVYRAFDSMENAWETPSKNGQGFFEVVPRAIDWIAVHFELPALPPAANNKPPRKLRLSVNAANRSGVLWWHVDRCFREGGHQDEFDTALQPIFTSPATAEGWQGLIHSAAAQVGGGIEPLLMRISDAIKAVATGVPAPAPASMGASLGAAIVLD